MSQAFADRVAIVTGAGRGIGRETALRLARGGARVVIADLAGDRAKAVAAEIGEGALAITLDTFDRPAVDAMVTEAKARWGRIDILINNAGFTHTASFLDITQADWQHHIDVNLTGYFNCAQAAAREMAKAGFGRIVSIASIAGLMGPLDFPAYGAAKSGVVGLTRAMALELADHGITANAIAPGPVDTELLREAWSPEAYTARSRHIPVQRLAQPGEIAHAALMLCDPEASYINGVVLPVDGGAHAAGAYMSEKFRRREVAAG